MTVSTRDAYVFRRLLVGHTLNGELAVVSDPFRSLASLLNTMEPAGRLCAWQGALTLRNDHEEIRRIVMAADPNGQCPLKKLSGSPPRLMCGE